MSKPNTLEVCRLHLFDDVDTLRRKELAEMLVKRILRIRSAYTLWLEYPRKKDAEIRDHLMTFGIKKSEAYEDIQIIKLLLGDMTETSKAFHRFRFIAMVEKAYDLAERKKDPKAMVAAADKYAKYNQLDKEDALRIPWDEIIIQPFEPTSDPTVIGIKPIANIREKIEGMKAKYAQDIIEDINFEEVDMDEESIFNAPIKLDEV
ncbi:MAG: hypothetical protein LBQ39_06960 [Tannerellaceae bacterium]|jgi:hypothetical protein|nr:hypothetical protein [Tannerellaceae bacterium]